MTSLLRKLSNKFDQSLMNTAYRNATRAIEAGDRKWASKKLEEFVGLQGGSAADKKAKTADLFALFKAKFDSEKPSVPSPSPRPLAAASSSTSNTPRLVGISRQGNYCGENSTLQFLANAPDIACTVMQKNQRVNRLLRLLLDGEEVRATLPNACGPALRQQVLGHQAGGDQLDVANDILMPLLNNSGFQYDFREQKYGAHSSNGSVAESAIVLGSKVERWSLFGTATFQELFDQYFDHQLKKGLRRKLQFRSVPQDLVVVARLYDKSGRKRSLKDVSQRLTLDSKFTTSGEKAEYELTGCIVHEGDSIRSGHYVYLRKIGNQWYKIDDDKISLVRPDQLNKLLQNGYVFHFSKKGTPVAQSRSVSSGGSSASAPPPPVRAVAVRPPLPVTATAAESDDFGTCMSWTVWAVYQTTVMLLYAMSLPFQAINRSLKKD